MMADPRRFPSCRCLWKRCGCSGGIHSFASHYRRLLQRLRPRRILEWGPGESTRVALEQPTLEEIVSIEHNPKWLPPIDDSRWRVIMAQTDEPGYVDLHGLEDVDLFFVDARRRVECLELTLEQARPGAAVCLHDAQRERYHEALARFERVEFLAYGFAVAWKKSPVRVRAATNGAMALAGSER